MLEIKNLTIEYDKDKAAVKNFNMSISSGEITAIAGESGSGKTTVIKAVLGALNKGKVTEGEILFNNENLLNKSYEEWRRLRGTKISMIFQDCGGTLNPVRKIGSQYIEYIRAHEKKSKKEAYEKAVEILKKMNLPDAENIMNSYPHELSRGMRQRVGIAMGMTFNPELLLADEPTSALDVTTQAQIINYMIEIKKKFNTSIIIVTHNLGVASYMSDNIIVMKNGVIEDAGKTKDVLKNPKSAYTKALIAAVPEMEEDYLSEACISKAERGEF